MHTVFTTGRHHRSVEQLNSFLRGELAAVESYQRALEKLGKFAHRTTLEFCAQSHRHRAVVLSHEVRRRGGRPATSSGVWGAIVTALERGSVAFGVKLAIALLEEGEDHGRDDYDRDLDRLDPEARQFVAQWLLPEQVRTHGAMSELKRRLVV